ncbi:DUF3408 domain-containing protein [Paenimyroides viscosum]|uniref:DUF3408 domain-containing protein n=1 Tax=Paenimyroides viscosum TaxID=2488729 RepID=A0A3P1B3A0_9FLAO|nr:DUF3408 domain-containing protein [Paenimyroides viscosum]RRA95569.1 DUF3408 domain-containing protein [Paenimyroides viscosum]
MEKDNKRKATPDIDEELMMNLMVDGVKKEGLKLPPEPPAKAVEKEEDKVEEPTKEKPVVREKSRTKRTNETDYENTFFKKSETNARDGKTVYIRPEFHEKLTRIIQVIGEDKISIYAYLDNLLDYHFQEFAEQITKSYNDKYKPI